MRNKYLFLTLLVAALSFLSIGSAAAAERIGFVNIQESMAKAPQVKAAENLLKQEFGAREKALVAQRDAIRQQEANLRRNAAVMSAASKTAAEKKLREEMSKFNSTMASFNADVSAKRTELLQGLQKKISLAITKVAKRDGYDMILSSGVAYASKRVDLTAQVLREMGSR